jgi:hypothetical protein
LQVLESDVYTPLSFAIGNGPEAVVKLFDKGADIELKTAAQFTDQTPIWLAAASGHLEDTAAPGRRSWSRCCLRKTPISG